jgi:malate dehydrogenase (oxaloacetate-decarboxylating)(NADP+)
MRPVFEVARRNTARVVFAEGEDERTLRAVQTVLDEGLAEPILIGRRAEIAARAHAMGLRMDFRESVRIVDPQQDAELFARLTPLAQQRLGRRGVPPDTAARRVLSRPTIAAAALLEAGMADAALVGGMGDWFTHWHDTFAMVGKQPEVARVYALSALILPNGHLFFVDTHLTVDPTPEQIADMTLLAAEQIRAFGITPKAALLSHSSYGASGAPSAQKMRRALKALQARNPDFEVDGEMHADAALVPAIRDRAVPNSTLTDAANLLVMPDIDAANIAFNLLKAAAEGLQVGPILLGMAKPIHVLVPSVTARGIVNMTALAAAQANGLKAG